MPKRVLIAHCTTVHPRADARIFVKQCRSLSETFGGTVLVVADGKGDAVDAVSGLSIVDIGARFRGGRVGRMIVQPFKMFSCVRRLGPVVVHFHDPELIPAAVLLKVFGHKIIYDVHENVAQQILSKHWIPGPLRRSVAVLFKAVEWLGVRVFDGVVAATPTIGEKFPAAKTVVVQNFPLVAEFSGAGDVAYGERPAAVGYVGGITRVRGAVEMVSSLGHLSDIPDLSLHLAGHIDPPVLREELAGMAGWQNVREHGFVERSEVVRLLSRLRAGLVLLHPTPAYLDSLPVKMFEYMAAGVPVIASDFPKWREIVEEAGCGLVVDPLRPLEIAEAVRWILDNPVEASRMGQRGRDAIIKTYNWRNEAETLIWIYNRLLDEKRTVS